MADDVAGEPTTETPEQEASTFSAEDWLKGLTDEQKEAMTKFSRSTYQEDIVAAQKPLQQQVSQLQKDLEQAKRRDGLSQDEVSRMSDAEAVLEDARGVYEEAGVPESILKRGKTLAQLRDLVATWKEAGGTKVEADPVADKVRAELDKLGIKPPEGATGEAMPDTTARPGPTQSIDEKVKDLAAGKQMALKDKLEIANSLGIRRQLGV